MTIGITLGEFFGIGPEILIKTYQELKSDFPPSIIYGNRNLMEKKAKELQVKPFWNSDSISLQETFEDPVKKESFESRGKYVLSMLDQSIADASSGTTSAVVTCPIDKLVVRHALSSFTGHTEYFEEKTGVFKTVMLLDNKEFSIALLSNHVSLRKVSEVLTSDSVEQIIRTSQESFSRHFGISRPKMAILGVNPHAGELDEQAEEKTILTPLIHKLKSEKMNIDGPFPADSFFAKARNQSWDIVFSPFHDQGLVAAKYNGLANVVNVTLGMSFLRVSPAHGVAYDIVDQNIADHRSFKRALLVAHQRTLKA